MEEFGRTIVLLIEPHQLMRRITRDILRVIGVGAIEVAETIEDGYRWLKENHADVVFVDWSSATDALALIRLLRADDSPNPFVPVVVASAYGDREHVRDARDAGASEYMLKPFAPQTVVTRMRAVVAHPRPFIRCNSFFGPDRRRHHTLDFSGPEQRRSARYVERRSAARPFAGPDRRTHRPSQRVTRTPQQQAPMQ